MRTLFGWLARLGGLFHSRQQDREFAAEIESHLQLHIADNIRLGMTPAEARRQAFIQLGGLEQTKEAHRDQRGLPAVAFLFQDLRFGARLLRKNPAFTVVAVLTLALCLGANLAVFAVVDAIVLKALPFPNPDQLVTMFNSYPKAGVERDGSSLANYYERRSALPAFAHLSIFRPDTAIIGEVGATTRQDVIRISPEFFSTLGIGPRLGRSFHEEEMTYQTDGVALITDAYWRRSFVSDPHVLGRTLRVDGLPKTIVGVLPPEFRFLSSRAEIFLPLSSSLEQRGPRDRHSGSGSDIIARLKPGVTLAQARAQIDASDAALASTYPRAQMMADAGYRTILVPLRADHIKSIQSTLLLLQVAALFLLLIGGFNLVNLLLIRANSRSRELGIRQSLGASQSRVACQVITEIVLLTALGGAGGLAMGAAGIRLLTALGVRHLPLGAEVAFNGRLAGMALIATLAMGLIIALPIVWFNRWQNPGEVLHGGARGNSSSLAAQNLRHGFMVAQIALAFILLAGTGMLGLSLQRVLAVPPGFRVDHILTGRISLSARHYRDDTARLGFTERLLAKLNNQPGVVAAGLINSIPFVGDRQKSAISVEGHLARPGESVRGHYRYGVAGDFFAAMGIPLREGRFLDASDSTKDVQVCVVDEDFAKRYWPRGGAVGQRLFQRPVPGPAAEAFTVVGVVGSIKKGELTDHQGQGAVYFSYRHHGDDRLFVVTRTQQLPDRFGSTLQATVRSIDPELPVSDLRSMETRLSDSLVGRRSPALLTGIFAMVAVTLAAIGTYGVLAYAAAQRRREIGIRLALGALPRAIARQFLSLGLRLLVSGIFLGALGAWLAGRAMQGILFNVPALPALTLVGAALLLSVVALAATWLPAFRASRIDPLEALRSE